MEPTEADKKLLLEEYKTLQDALNKLEAEDQPKESGLKKAGRVALGGLGAAGKALDAPSAVSTRPLAALAMEAITGKDVYRPGEVLDAINPTNLKTYPSSSELMERAGVPEGAKLSDYMGGFAEHDERNPWYRPEKGGRLDVTLRGAGGFGTDMALDPLNYLSLGLAGLSKKAALEAAAKEVGKAGAEKGLASKALQSGANLFTMGPEAAVTAAKALPGGETAVKVAGAAAQAPSKGIAAVGKKIYESGLIPVEHQGKKFNKKDVAETFYKNDIWGTAPSVAEQAGKAEARLKAQLDQIKSAADAAGGQVDLTEAFGPFVHELEQALDQARITPEEAKKLYNEFVGRYWSKPEPNVSTASKWKTDTYDRISKAPMSQSAFDVTKYSDLENQLGKTAGHGLKEAVETATDRALGEGVGTVELATKNDDWGKLLTTKNALRTMANNAEKKRLVTVGDLAFFGGGAAAGGDAKMGALAVAAKKLLEASRTTVGRTGTGYALRKTAEGQLTGPLLDALLRREFINKVGPKPITGNPEVDALIRMENEDGKKDR